MWKDYVARAVGAYLTVRVLHRAIRPLPGLRYWFWMAVARLLISLEKLASCSVTQLKMDGGGKEVSKRKALSDVQRQCLAAVYERCVRIAELEEDFESAGARYPQMAEMGRLQEVEEEIRQEIDQQLDLLLEDVLYALEFRVPASKITVLREKIIPEQLRDLFPVITVGGKPI